ncbi:hypothetical protein PDO_1834 [Rhizobium sp. PDO1-076]|uniref:DUF6074 family protein n=1 Tax=Rhizobium sp. PDO1-076 TaxID=1125979 RepID=UPI00024E325C|nr:DUF6074 family protein [Rhizobium sp. PDO1-076]EHS51576.1 hypothetical protein PDO_1834 [Rhizobium sp. PDO1-076]
MSDQAMTGQTNPSIAFFPLANRTDLVRRSAVELDRLNGYAAVEFWKTTCRALGAELLSLGCPEDEMRVEIMDFQAAVQMELMWLHRAEEARG